ncbi:MAG: pyridoxamine 5'-phosphate oxidase family protein [Planctomycetota bacterium]|nr:pyridoxamine 5'-phosphate oxidase family protein [Planctomycetota bacterium]
MTSSPDAQERMAAVKHLREMIHDIPVAMLTTVAPDGSLNSRPMVNVNEQFDGDLWFFTAFDDPKVAEIAAHPTVNVSFADTSKGRYVSAAGKAELVRDEKRIELHWTDGCEPWFPKGPQDPNLGLLKVDVESAEYWDQQQGTMVAVAGFFKRLVTGDKSASVKSEQVDWPA